jgi:DNA-binding NtrC family response regulator
MSGDKRLLVLDDDPGVVEYLCEMLSERGFEVAGITSPRAALARLEAESFDLVITDVEMPEMRGTDLLEAILARNPAQLVLLITAFGSIELAVASVQAGACDFVAKPFKIEALVFAIERAFRDRQMRREIVRLRTTQPLLDGGGQLVARSPAMRRVLESARRAARADSTVLLTGETGTGKSAVARYIHDMSGRAAQPFFQVNCASLPAPLVESELFGVRRGAFTDAREDRPGAFVAAAGGTLFLDEIGELPMEVQAKLLHALENGAVRRLGDATETPINARIIAATNRPLETLLRERQFRPDLYYRLNVIRIDVPPLRERRDDIGPLVDLLLARACERQTRVVVGVSAGALRRLVGYGWPGNVRELANALERAVALGTHDTLLADDLDLPNGGNGMELFLADRAEGHMPLREVERSYVRHVVQAQGGNKAAAARILGINRRTLYRILDS